MKIVFFIITFRMLAISNVSPHGYQFVDRFAAAAAATEAIPHIIIKIRIR